MKALLIDIKMKAIKEIEIGEDFREISKAIGCEVFTCPHVLENNDTLYCDDEGLLKPVEGFFLLDSYPQPIAGNGLILGCDDEGESKDAVITIDELAKRVKFMDMNEAYNWAQKSYYQFN